MSTLQLPTRRPCELLIMGHRRTSLAVLRYQNPHSRGHRATFHTVSLLGTWVNKGKKKGRGCSKSPGPSHIYSSRTLCVAYDFALYATTSPAVTWGGFGIKEGSCSSTNSPALKVDCSSAALCSKTLIPTITPSPASTK